MVLPVLIVNGSTATIGCGCCSLPLPKATGHGRVKSCRVVQPPGRHPDIGACSSGRGGRSPLFSISGLWPAACARAASRERRRWSRFVRSPPHGHRTGPQCRHARGAHANQDLEKRAGEMQAKGFTWRRMQPGPRPQGPARAEGEPDSFQHLRWQHQLRDNCSVHRLRQLLLPKVGRRRDREGVSSGHHRINSPKSVIQWRNAVRI